MLNICFCTEPYSCRTYWNCVLGNWNMNVNSWYFNLIIVRSFIRLKYHEFTFIFQFPRTQFQYVRQLYGSVQKQMFNIPLTYLLYALYTMCWYETSYQVKVCIMNQHRRCGYFTRQMRPDTKSFTKTLCMQ
jgi:hypothetical protein